MIKVYNKNKYFLTTTGLWVRDYTQSLIPEDINKLVPHSDYNLFLNNEMENAKSNLAAIDAETIFAPNVIIVSDGYKFEEKQHLLKNISQKVTIIGVNHALSKWKVQRRMDWYLTNNPYQECLSFLPKHNYYPRCIVSSRTNPQFVNRYRARSGVVYRYSPVCDKKFSSNYFMKPIYYVDDYRNPICAAIAIASKWEVRKLLLLCCDDVFDSERSGTEQLTNGKWMYPQQKISHGLIEGNLYWLKKQEVEVADHSSGPEYKDVQYITEDFITEFFS